MKNNEIHKTVQSDFLKNVSEILLQARKNAKTAVNLSMVYAYYEIGRMIVEEEQHGASDLIDQMVERLQGKQEELLQMKKELE